MINSATHPIENVPSTASCCIAVCNAVRRAWDTKRAQDWIESSAYRTRHVRQQLIDSGRKLELEVYCHDREKGAAAGTGEYLVDIGWACCSTPGWKGHLGLIMACECEWNRAKDEILGDFMKLCDVRAKLRVMICPKHKDDPHEPPPDYVSMLVGHTRRHLFSTPHDEYMLFALPDKDDGCEPSVYTWDPFGAIRGWNLEDMTAGGGQ